MCGLACQPAEQICLTYGLWRPNPHRPAIKWVGYFQEDRLITFQNTWKWQHYREEIIEIKKQMMESWRLAQTDQI